MRKIKKNDEVIVISGKDKGKRGIVLAVVDKGEKLLIDGINIVYKTVKANPNSGADGQIIRKALPVWRSKVMLYDASTGKGGKVGIRVNEAGVKLRYFKSTGVDV